MITSQYIHHTQIAVVKKMVWCELSFFEDIGGMAVVIVSFHRYTYNFIVIAKSIIFFIIIKIIIIILKLNSLVLKKKRNLL